MNRLALSCHIIGVLTIFLLIAACGDEKPKRKVEDCDVTFRTVRSDDIRDTVARGRIKYDDSMLHNQSDKAAFDMLTERSQRTWLEMEQDYAGKVEMNGHGYTDRINSVLAAYDSEVRVTIYPFFGTLCSNEKVFRAVSDGFPRAEQNALRATPRGFAARAQQWDSTPRYDGDNQWWGKALLEEYFPQQQVMPLTVSASTGEPPAARTCEVKLAIENPAGISWISGDGQSRSCGNHWCKQLLAKEAFVESLDTLQKNLTKIETVLAETEAGMFAPQTANNNYTRALLSAIFRELGIFSGIEITGSPNCDVQDVLEEFFRKLPHELWEKSESHRDSHTEGAVMALAAVTLSPEDIRPTMERALRDAAATAVPFFALRGGTYEITPTTETSGVVRDPVPEPL